MKHITKTALLLLALVSYSTFAAPASNAVVLSSSETIEDPVPFELFHRDLTRTRVDGSGNIIVENDDATIISENNVDNDFGITNFGTVTYRHDLTWLTPPADTFLFASLSIKSFGNIGGNDIVEVETIELGALVDGTLGSGFFSTTVFNSSNPLVLNALLADGYLDISIDKNVTGGILSQLNAVSIYSSTLHVRYEAVPEPGTMVLLATGGLLGLARRRKAVAAEQ